jgi:hypothetical protein
MRSFIHATAARTVETGCEIRSATVGMIQLRVTDALYLRFLTLPVLGWLVNCLGTSMAWLPAQMVTSCRPPYGAHLAKPGQHRGSARHRGLRTARPRD